MPNPARRARRTPTARSRQNVRRPTAFASDGYVRPTGRPVYIPSKTRQAEKTCTVATPQPRYVHGGVLPNKAAPALSRAGAAFLPKSELSNTPESPRQPLFRRRLQAPCQKYSMTKREGTFKRCPPEMSLTPRAARRRIQAGRRRHAPARSADGTSRRCNR